ncbi:MAG: hypothetical protein ACKVOM_13090 [Ferruginibacter sp.]
MRKILLLTGIFMLFLNFAQAQSKVEKKYAERSAEVQQEVWNNGDKAFDVKEVPAKYKNESAVIIAKSYDVSNSTKRKFKMTTIFGGTVQQYKYYTTFRERVLIQDKAALEDYATVNYKKIVDNTYKAGMVKFVNTTKTYIGVKVFKTTGKIVDINASEEEVLTNNTDKKKEGKLAIPDLQVGDVLDYFVRVEEVIEDQTEVKGPDLFFMGSEYPTIWYNVKYTLDKKCGADILNLNGVNPMSVSSNSDDDIVLEFTQKDMPAVKNTFWTSQAREIPYYVVRYGFPGTGIEAPRGEVRRGPFTQKYKNYIKNTFLSLIQARMIDMAPKKYVKSYFDGKIKPKELPDDSIINCLYNYYKWQQYKSFSNLDVSNSRNYENMSWFNMAVSFSETLRDFDIDNDIVIVCNRYSGRLKEIFGVGDVETFVKINGKGNFKWVCFNDFFQNTGQLNADYQGEDALILTREGKDRRPKYEDNETPIKLPVAKSAENVSAEKLTVSFNQDNFQTITIERLCSETGAMKQGDQKSLLLAEDVEAELAALIEKKKNVDVLAENKKTKQKALEIQTAMDKERQNQKDYFEADIKLQFEQEPKEMIGYKVLNTGLNITKPAFEYAETFTMENFVKKAGSNFIFDVGKLMGSYTKTSEKDRTRTQNIYMPSARTLTYSFAVTIPDGYRAKGVEELNKKVENECASFEATAVLNGNILNVMVTRIYKNNYEPVANWPKLLQAMDAAADFTGSKLLLEKVK